MSLNKQHRSAKDVDKAVEEAAVTTSKILVQNEIAYAVIGGHALKLLGNDRTTFVGNLHLTASRALLNPYL